VRITLAADWDAAPEGKSVGTVRVETAQGEPLEVQLPIEKPAIALAGDFRGFVESDRTIAIEAPHYTRVVNASDATWKTLPDFGRTEGGVTIYPVTAATRTPESKTPRLEYDFFAHSTGDVRIELHYAPSLDFQSGEGLRIAVSVDDGAPQVLKLETYAKENWERAVAENIRRIASTHALDKPGVHTLKVWMVTPGVVLERIVIDAGGVRPSYLGPPESLRLKQGS
jgi:hypothetical protein